MYIKEILRMIVIMGLGRCFIRIMIVMRGSSCMIDIMDKGN